MFKPGDLITNKRDSTATIWRVLKTTADGTILAKFERGGRLPYGKQLIKKITRPEEYRRINDGS